MARNGYFIPKYGATYVRTLFTDGHIEETYLSGIPRGELADRPSGAILTEFDAGLLYAATDAGALYRWSGTEWEILLSDSSGSGGGAGINFDLLTNGDPDDPDLVYADADVIWVILP